MVCTSKNDAGFYDVVVRCGDFPTQGKKVVLQKGTTKISLDKDQAYDILEQSARLLWDGPAVSASPGDFSGPYIAFVRCGKFPTQGNKAVVQKGTVKISLPPSDLPALIGAIAQVAADAFPAYWN